MQLLNEEVEHKNSSIIKLNIDSKIEFDHNDNIINQLRGECFELNNKIIDLENIISNKNEEI